MGAFFVAPNAVVCGALWCVGRCGVVGSTLAFGSTGRRFDPEHRYFHTIVHQPSAS